MTKSKNRRLSNISFENWNDDQFLEYIIEQEINIKVDQAHETAQKWWSQFRIDKKDRLILIATVVAEVVAREQTLDDFFQAYVWSQTDNIQAVLFFMDYIKNAPDGLEKIKYMTLLSIHFKDYVYKVLEHPEVASLISSKEYKELSADQQSKELFQIADKLNLFFLSDAEKLWNKYITRAFEISINSEKTI